VFRLKLSFLSAPWLAELAGPVLLLGLCAFWLVPFLARREWFEPLGYHWTDYPEMVRRLWTPPLAGASGRG
jgi:hypothetical protein